jgi:hypothetical protein
MNNIEKISICIIKDYQKDFSFILRDDKDSILGYLFRFIKNINKHSLYPFKIYFSENVWNICDFKKDEITIDNIIFKKIKDDSLKKSNIALHVISPKKEDDMDTIICYFNNKRDYLTYLREFKIKKLNQSFKI